MAAVGDAREADGGFIMVLMAGHPDAAELIFILLLVVLLFGDKLGGKSWRTMADQFAEAIQQLRGGDLRAHIDPAIVRDLTVLGIVCTVLAVELVWLATQI